MKKIYAVFLLHPNSPSKELQKFVEWLNVGAIEKEWVVETDEERNVIVVVSKIANS